MLFGHPERKTPLGKSRHTCEDTIKMSQINVMGGWMDAGLIRNDRNRVQFSEHGRKFPHEKKRSEESA
jgi:hypothetical protein